MFKKVLVTLDGSRFSGRALPYAVEIAKRFNGEVILLQVVKPTPLIVPASGSGAMASPSAAEAIIASAEIQDRRNIAKANRYLKKKIKGLTTHGVRSTHQAITGEPANAIIRFSRKNSIDLIAMTTRGKSGLKRAFLGSVADKVIRESGIPVLTIRPDSRRKK